MAINIMEAFQQEPPQLDFIWPGQATNPNTLKTRRQAARRALPELAALGWAVSEYAKNKFEIGRPKATHLLGPAPKTQEISHEK